MRSVVLLVLVTGCLVSSVSAATILVPSQQPTIQAGIDAASPGDEVVVAPGSYSGIGNENIHFDGKGVTLRSSGGAAVTTILAVPTIGTTEILQSTFIFITGEIASTVIEGFTITQQSGKIRQVNPVVCTGTSPVFRDCVFRDNRWYSVLLANNAAPRFEDCIFLDNLSGCSSCSPPPPSADPAQMWGAPVFEITNGSNVTAVRCQFLSSFSDEEESGAIHCENSSLTLTDCEFRDNYGFHYGGAVSVEQSQLTATGCWFAGNFVSPSFMVDAARGGAISARSSGVYIESCVFENNSTYDLSVYPMAMGGAIYVGGTSSGFVRNCTFVKNQTSDDPLPTRESGPVLYVDGTTTITVEHTIMANNGHRGGPVACGVSTNVVVLCCDVFGNAGGDWVGCLASQAGLNNNISSDPLFCDLAGGDYQIESTSGCAPSNNQCAHLIGALNVGCCCVGITGNVDGDGAETVDVGDLTYLIGFLFLSGPAPACPEEANVDGVGDIDVGDLTALIAFLFLSGASPVSCS